MTSVIVWSQKSSAFFASKWGLPVAVLAIIITAPLGAFAIDLSYRRLLEKEQ